MSHLSYKRRIIYNEEGTIIGELGWMEGDLLANLRPDVMYFVDVDDPRTPAIRVNPATKEVEWEPVDQAPFIEGIVASLIQQGITLDMLSQIQETMVQQSAPIRQ